MTPLADPTPADARALANEAIRLAEAATPGPWRTVASYRADIGTDAEWNPYVVANEHGRQETVVAATMQSREREFLANRDFIAHAGTHYATLARALLAALDEREAMLADLPHALGTCRCQVMNATPSVGWPKWVYPCTHTAAIARLEERIG